MTQLQSSSSSEKQDPSPTIDNNPDIPTIHINDEPEPSPQIRPTHTRTLDTHKPRNAAKRPSLCALWCRAGLLTILAVFAAYVWLSWTDPDQVEMRQMAWDAAMEKIKGKQVIHAQRYSDQHRFRPAASPIITETLTDGRKKVRGGRPGDDMPIPKPTGTAATHAKKKERRRKNKKKN